MDIGSLTVSDNLLGITHDCGGVLTRCCVLDASDGACVASDEG